MTDDRRGNLPPPGFSTKAVHAGQSPDPTTGAVWTPIYTSSTYVQESPGVHKGYEYSRSHNPTRQAFERCIAALEDGTRAYAFASGMAATATVLECLDSGAHVIASDDLYGGTYRLFQRVRARSAGLTFSFVDMSERGALEQAITPQTRMIWLETPSNPLLKLVDLAMVAEVARGRKILTVADNTFATPWIQKPLNLGIDLVLHSATKYINGHSDVVAGVVVVGDNPALAEQLTFLQNAVGGIAGPFDAYMALRGVKTLALRMERHCASAARVAEWLEGHPAIARVHYPGLASHPQHALAKPPDERLRRHGFGGREGRAGANQALPRALQPVRAGGKPGRRGEPDRAPGDHDACQRAGGHPRRARRRRRAGAAVGRDRGYRRPDRRPGAGALLGGAASPGSSTLRPGCRRDRGNRPR